jgi:hypothetical protein
MLRSKPIISQIIDGISADYEKDSEVKKKLDKVIDLLTSIKSQSKLHY